MSEIIWKKFRLDEIFKRNTPPSTDSPAKELEIFEKPFSGSIALITRAEKNNGIRGYIEKKNFPTAINAITYNDQFSLFLFHPYEFTTIKDHLSILTAKSNEFQKILEKYDYISTFIVTLLNHVFSKKIFSFNFTGADYRFDREVILLPCIKVDSSESYIFEDNDGYYIIAKDYIKKLMDISKEKIEEKTIKKYIAKKEKYEIEIKAYQEKYLLEKKNVVWKKFTLDELFKFDSSNQLSSNKKALDISDIKNDKYHIALITQSEKNNGITGYLKSNEEIEDKKMINYLTYSMHFGLCFYHDYDFVLMDTHGSVFKLLPKESGIKKSMDENKYINLFISSLITKVCKNGVYNYSWLPNSTRVGREMIILPCLENDSNNDYTFEKDKKIYSLSSNFISYIYLESMIKKSNNIIDRYKFKY